jgi:hypothetical protein
MSPHYAQVRDGNKTTIPESYLPGTYQVPAFRIEPLDRILGKPSPAASPPESATP